MHYCGRLKVINIRIEKMRIELVSMRKLKRLAELELDDGSIAAVLMTLYQFSKSYAPSPRMVPI